MTKKVNWLQRIFISICLIFSFIAIGNTFSYMGRQEAKKNLQVDDYINADFDYFEIKDAVCYNYFQNYNSAFYDEPFIFSKSMAIDLKLRKYIDTRDNYNYLYPYQFTQIPKSSNFKFLDAKEPDDQSCYQELSTNEDSCYSISVGDSLLKSMTEYGFRANGTYYEPNTITIDNILGFCFTGICTLPGRAVSYNLIVTSVHHIDGTLFNLKKEGTEDLLSYSFCLDRDLARIIADFPSHSYNNYGYICKKITDRKVVRQLRNAYDEDHMRWKKIDNTIKDIKFWPWIYYGELDWISFLWFLIFFILAMIPYTFLNIIDIINIHTSDDFIWFSKKNGFMLLIDYLLFLICFLFIHFFALTVYPLWVPLLIVLSIPSLLMLILELIASLRVISQSARK